MCGIAGFFNLSSNDSDHLVIKRMTDALAHRGPDAEGIFRDGPVALGHRRLSIIDLSPKSNQPIFDSTLRYAIVFNGEIYNYKEVKSELSDYPFQTNGDTEVVLASFIRWGWKCLDRLKGMFAFAIWDKEKRRLHLARDRMGVKPLYIYQDDHVFLFASEIRSLLASGLVKRMICREALYDYLQFQSFQSPLTIVEGIRELESGCVLDFGKGFCQQSNYWSIERSPLQEQVSGDSVRKKVKELLLSAVHRRLVSDVPVAAFLSGGIDSTAIVALMAELTQAPETFNVSFLEESYDESEFAKVVSRKFGTRHHHIPVQPETFLAEFPNALNALDSPSGDGINTYIVTQAVRKEGIKVALSGIGGDELFAGYPIFQKWKFIQKFRYWWKFPLFIRSGLAHVVANDSIRGQRMAGILRSESPGIAAIYPLLRQVNSEESIESLLNGVHTTKLLQQSLESRQGAIRIFPDLSQLSIAEFIGYTRQTLLKDTDQMGMSSALEVREPFFDHDLVEYVVGLPDSQKQGKHPKSLLLESLGGSVKADFFNRPKKGFVLPGEQWFRNELRSFCDDKIQRLAKRDFIQGPALIHYWEDFLLRRKSISWTNIQILLALENYISLHGLE